MASEVTKFEEVNPAPWPPLKETNFAGSTATTPAPLPPLKEPGAENIVAANPLPLPPPKDLDVSALAINLHQKGVNEISTIVRDFYERNEKFYISHGVTNSTSRSMKGKTSSTQVLFPMY